MCEVSSLFFLVHVQYGNNPKFEVCHLRHLYETIVKKASNYNNAYPNIHYPYLPGVAELVSE